MADIKGDPMLRVWYGDVFAGYIFYKYHEHSNSEYKFWPEGRKVEDWIKHHPECALDTVENVNMQDKNDENYGLAFEILKKQALK